MAKKLSRRNFLIATGAVGGTLLLGGYVAAELAEPERAVSDRLLGKPLTELPQIEGAWRYQGDALTLDMSKLPELDELGGAVRIEGDVLPEPILVFQGEDSVYYAFKNVCPHAGRKIDPIKGTMTLECCSVSSSTFDYEGKVLSGPAKEPLQRYTMSLSQDQLTIILD